MKLTAIELRRFGRFEGRVVELPADAGLHVVYGGNEAGKTTTLDAVTYALHGMPQGGAKEPNYGFVHALPSLRVGLRLLKDDGTQLHFVRKRGRANTVLDPVTDGADASVEALLEGTLRGVDRSVWVLRHGLSQRRLREGGEALLASGGDAADALFAAATGIGVVRGVLDEVRERRRALLADSGRTGELHVAIQQYEEARRAVKAAVDASAGYDEDVSRRDEIIGERERAVGERAALVTQAERLEAVRRSAGALAQRARLVEQRDAIEAPPVPWTRADHEELTTANAELEQATELAADLAERVRLEQGRLDALVVHEALLAAGDQVAALLERVGSAREAGAAVAGLEADLLVARRALEEAVAALGLTDALDGDDTTALTAAVPSVAARDAVAAAATDGEQLARDVAAADRGVELTGRRLEAAQAKLDALVLGAGGGAQDALVPLVAAAGAVDLPALRARRARAGTLRAALEHRAAALPGCDLDLAGVRSLELPADDDRVALERRFAELDAQEAEQRALLQQAVDHLRDRRAELDELEAGVDVPDPARLTVLRTERDELWSTIRSGVLGGAGGTLADASAAVPGFEQVSRSADGLADDLARDGQRVGAATRLRSEIQRDVEREAVATDRLAQIAAERERSEAQDWAALWSRCGVVASSPAAMQAFVDEVAAIRADVEALDEVETGVAVDVDRVAGLVRQLRAALDGDAATGADEDDASLEALLARARAEVEAAAAARTTRTQLETSVEGAREQHAEAQHAVLDARGALEAWSTRWASACAAAGIAVEASVADARGRLAAVANLDEAVATFAAARTRLAAARAVVDGFAADVLQLLDGLGDEAVHLAGRAPELVLPALHQQLTDTRLAHAARRTLHATLDELAARQVEAQARLAAAQRRADAVLERAPGLTHERVLACDASWVARDAVEREVELLDHGLLESTRMHAAELVELGAGRDDVEIASAVARLAEEVAMLDAQLAALEKERDGLVERIGGVVNSTAHAQAQQRRGDALATIERLVPEYRSLALQEQLLADFLELQAHADKGPVIALASDYFTRLTCDRYSGIRLDTDEQGRVVLRADRVGPDGASTGVGVDGMSEGTRDQLYLALRLATLVTALDDGAETMPLVVDDVLLTFDDERSAATLALLGEISARMQVIFLTHHARLVELAREVVDDGALAVVELGHGDAEPASAVASS